MGSPYLGPLFITERLLTWKTCKMKCIAIISTYSAIQTQLLPQGLCGN